MKKMQLLALLLVVTMVFTGCFRSEAEEGKEEAYKTVETQEVKMRISDRTLKYSGVVKSQVQKNMSFKTSGRVAQILVNEGEYIEAGQAVAILDTTDTRLQVSSISSQLSASQKNVALAKESYDYNASEYNKSKTLHEAGIISSSSFDAATLGYDQAKLSYEMAQDSYNQLQAEKGRLDEMLSEGTLMSDQSGIVDDILVEEYEIRAAGAPVISLRSTDQMVVTHVTSGDRNQIEIDQKVKLIVDGQTLEGAILFIDDAADAQTHSYRVEIGFNHTQVTNGSVANIDFVVGQYTGIWIPIQSVQTSTLDFVYLVNEDRTEKRAIEILEVKGDEVLIEGLERGEQLIVSGMKSLIEGMLVKAME